MAVQSKTDTNIAMYVMEELDYDPEIASAQLDVRVMDGQVTLMGLADTLAIKQAAENAAWRVEGVRVVINDIVVDHAAFAGTLDDHLRHAVENALDNNLLVPAGRIFVAVQDRCVTLTGSTTWNFQRKAAVWSAHNVEGVREVINEIALQQPKVSPHKVETDIANALERSAHLDADRIRAQVDGGNVTLTGTVRSWVEWQEAEDAAWCALGVTHVTNNIVIVPDAVAAG